MRREEEKKGFAAEAREPTGGQDFLEAWGEADEDGAADGGGGLSFE